MTLIRRLDAWDKILEFLVPMVAIFALDALSYNKIGALVQARNVDYSYLIRTKFDDVVPLVKFFVFPYLYAWISGFVIAVLLLFTETSLPELRRIFFCAVLLYLTHVVLWFLFPVSAVGLVPELKDSSGIMNRLLQLTYQDSSMWNSFPSTHVSLPWLFCLFSRPKCSRYVGFVLLALTVAITLSTMFVKIHFVADAVSGMVLAFGMYYLVYAQMEKNNFLGRISSFAEISLYLSLLVAVVSVNL